MELFCEVCLALVSFTFIGVLIGSRGEKEEHYGCDNCGTEKGFTVS